MGRFCLASSGGTSTFDKGYLDALEESIVFSHPQVGDEEGEDLVWAGKSPFFLSREQSEVEVVARS